MIQFAIPGHPNIDYRVTQWHGENPATYSQFGLIGHNGIDIAPKVPGTSGVILYAPHDGIVRQYNEGDRGYGRYIELIDQANGRKSILAHLEKYLVPANWKIKTGEPIAIMGGAPGMDGAGFSSGIHLHLGYKAIDPKTGATLNHNNGFKGSLDIAKYITIPEKGHLPGFLTLGDFNY